MATSIKKGAVATRDAEGTKVRILDAAEEEFAKGGLLGARTEAIAANIGVTKSMIFYHFGDKEGLYQAVLERAIAQRMRTIQKIDIHSIEPKEAMRALVGAFIDDIVVNKNLPAIFFYEGIQNKGKYYGQIAIESIYRPFVDVIERGIKDGQFRKCDPLHASVNIMGMCVFYFCHHENVKHLWPAGTDLLSKEMRSQHRSEAVAQVVASLLA
jgi:TetR/AcrR family transcriptional regulator